MSLNCSSISLFSHQIERISFIDQLDEFCRLSTVEEHDLFVLQISELWIREKYLSEVFIVVKLIREEKNLVSNIAFINPVVLIFDKYIDRNAPTRKLLNYTCKQDDIGRTS